MSKKDNKKDQKQDELAKKIKEAQEAEQKIRDEENKKIEEEDSSEMEQVKKDLAEMTETAKRTFADLQNLKRRQLEDAERMRVSAKKNIIKDLLPSYDNLKRALSHKPDSDKKEEILKWSEGIEMAINQMDQALNNNGLEKIESIGEKFNPDLHEALVQGPGEKDVIIEELEFGYKIGNQVIRHAKVKVGNGDEE